MSAPALRLACLPASADASPSVLLTRRQSWGFTIFTSLATALIVLYAELSARLASWQAAHNPWAVLALDAVAVVFWLASMAALAAKRASFIYDTTVTACVNYGYGGICYERRDGDLARRAVATIPYLDMMSGAAGLAAIEM